MGGAVEQPAAAVVVERVEDGGGDRERKKNKRRASRRSKQNSPIPASCSANEICGGGLSHSLGNGSKTNSYAASVSISSGQPVLGVNVLYNCGGTPASDVTFSSMPTMHLNEQAEPLFPSSIDGPIFSNSLPEPMSTEHSCGTYTGKVMHPLHMHEGSAQIKFFSSYWSTEAVDEALKKGDAFRASFRVNAHNRLEAYCKIEGVPTDVLISGIASQNRAVEGDVVVIKVDPLAFWTKMKGSNGPSNNVLAEDGSLFLEVDEKAGGSFKSKRTLEVNDECAYFDSFLCSQRGYHNGDSSSTCDPVLESNGLTGCNAVNEQNAYASDYSYVIWTTGQKEAVNGVGRLCAMLGSFPLKRPTGRVMAIIERSPRRETIVGFLDIRQWLYQRQRCRKDTKKKKNPLPFPDCDYSQLTPTDPRFPKMMVLVKGLPDCIRKRLEDGDATVEMELVAAQIVDWAEDSPFPEAHVSHSFGRGSEIEPRVNAILYENAICCSDFSPESLACLPHDAWEVPMEELQTRKDLRNLCIFTIDPSTATDLDDALSVERLPNGTVRVGVHIADVSYFVLPDTALDVEAQLRSTSVYMLRHKLSMLPPLLSENLGSLNPGVDRLAFSMFWDLNSSLDVVDRWIGRTIIRSCCKLAYEHAQGVIDGVFDEVAYKSSGNDLPHLHGHFEWSDIIRCIKTLHEISKNLRLKRFRDGAVQLESSKFVFWFDENGIPYDGILSEPMDSDFLVEEFMLLANKTAAEVISRAFPDSALLRRHPEPDMRKLREFEAFCCKHGLEVDTSSSSRFHWSLERIREKLKDDSLLLGVLISYAMKPMQLAMYFCTGDLKDKTSDWGHYALALPLYTHFTSPLRRYPDIIVHRTLAAAIEAEKLYMKGRRISRKVRCEEEVTRCFTGIHFDRIVAESLEGKELLIAAARKYKVPCSEILADIASVCNSRKLASRHVKDACDKLYMWALLKKREVILSEARVLGLGPRFMSIYIAKLAVERRIYYDDIESLTVEWLEATSTLVLSLCAHKRSSRRFGPGYYRALENVACVIDPYDLEETGMVGQNAKEPGGASVGKTGAAAQHIDLISRPEIDPMVFPLTICLLSTIPVALHAVGGDDGPTDIGVKLLTSSYFR